VRRVRRLRYSGKNPRRFDQKYKEHQPEKYAEDVARIVASGKTLAGTHRPILVGEILEVLALKPGEVVVDCTLGFGGHAREMLARIVPGGRLLGFDVDPIEQPRTVERLRAAGYGEDAFVPVRGNFAGLAAGLGAHGLVGADAILADLGVSSMQIDDPSRGFSFKADGPLDLRLNPTRGRSAAQWLAEVSETELAEALAGNADEPAAALLAKEIVRARSGSPFQGTRQFSGFLHEVLRNHRLSRDKEEGDARIRRVFQALRIAVNDEFGALEAMLRQLPLSLNPGGRVAILTFHSGEDRRVKKAFQEGERSGLYDAVSDTVIRPGPEELRSNPRSSSAKLRWAMRAMERPPG
jgi:16S rRNA (cytosine1402-N4)-methyltransferase